MKKNRIYIIIIISSLLLIAFSIYSLLNKTAKTDTKTLSAYVVNLNKQTLQLYWKNDDNTKCISAYFPN